MTPYGNFGNSLNMFIYFVLGFWTVTFKGTTGGGGVECIIVGKVKPVGVGILILIVPMGNIGITLDNVKSCLDIHFHFEIYTVHTHTFNQLTNFLDTDLHLGNNIYRIHVSCHLRVLLRIFNHLAIERMENVEYYSVGEYYSGWHI